MAETGVLSRGNYPSIALPSITNPIPLNPHCRMPPKKRSCGRASFLALKIPAAKSAMCYPKRSQKFGKGLPLVVFPP